MIRSQGASFVVPAHARSLPAGRRVRTCFSPRRFDPYWLGGGARGDRGRFLEKGDGRVDALVDVTPAH
jgi:hypothetical protein